MVERSAAAAIKGEPLSKRQIDSNARSKCCAFCFSAVGKPPLPQNRRKDELVFVLVGSRERERERGTRTIERRTIARTARSPLIRTIHRENIILGQPCASSRTRLPANSRLGSWIHVSTFPPMSYCASRFHTIRRHTCEVK